MIRFAAKNGGLIAHQSTRKWKTTRATFIQTKENLEGNRQERSQISRGHAWIDLALGGS